MDRRQLLKTGLLAAAAAGSLPGLARAAAPGYSRRCRELVDSALVIDMLAPLELDFRAEAYAEPLPEEEAAEFRACGITGFHNAVGVGGRDAHTDALAFLAAWQGFVGRNTHLFTLVDVPGDLDRAKAEGKIAVIMGLQNAEQFRSTDDVRFFRGLGLRCAQLTYNRQNRLGSGSTERVDGGLSDFGVAIVHAMNDAGMLVDVSHSGPQTTLDAIAVSGGPIAITHSNCQALCDHPRNKSDVAIRALAAKGGVMGITGVRMFVSPTDPTTVADMADHIDHAAEIAGIEHVGIGSDADLNGYDDMPPDQYEQLKAGYDESYAFREKIDIDGFDHPRKIFDLTEELMRRRYPDAEIRLVLGGNFHRLLEEAWRLPAADSDRATT